MNAPRIASSESMRSESASTAAAAALGAWGWLLTPSATAITHELSTPHRDVK